MASSDSLRSFLGASSCLFSDIGILSDGVWACLELKMSATTLDIYSKDWRLCMTWITFSVHLYLSYRVTEIRRQVAL